MIVLALECSTLLGTVALLRDGKLLAEARSFRQRSHSESMNSMVEDCLTQANLQLTDIDVFATGQGPGSFTGIRVAANIAKTYSYCFKKPLASLNSLENLALLHKKAGLPVMPMINAYKNMVYTGIYSFDRAGKMQTLLPASAIPVRELRQYVNDKILCVGDGWIDYHKYFHPELTEKISRPTESQDYPTALCLGYHAANLAHEDLTQDWKSFAPLYIRASEAEETKKGIFITPLS